MKMKFKSFIMLLAYTMLIAFNTACSTDKDEEINSGEVGNSENESVYKYLLGEWICCYQYWEEGGISLSQHEAYYNTDDLSLTFNEDNSGYLKSEGDDELMEVGLSYDFTYRISGQVIYAVLAGNRDEKWSIISLNEDELSLKWQDGDYFIIAKFVKRKSNEGKVKSIKIKTEYSGNTSTTFRTYSFVYNFNGDLNEIIYNNKKIVYELVEGNEMYITWYNGDKFKLIDNRKEGYYADVYLNNTLWANAKYDQAGYLVAVINGEKMIKYEYSNGNLISSEDSFGFSCTYEYSDEKNDVNIDLNYFIDEFSASYGNLYDYTNNVELGLSGNKSKNLISKIIIPNELWDYYLTYTYERDENKRISRILRESIDKYSGMCLNKSIIDVEYY